MKRTLLSSFTALALLACGGAIETESADDAIVKTPVERCGDAVCGNGETCCNPSCGICTAPGELCAAVECAPADAGKKDSAKEGVACGGTTCGVDEDCCNPTCGICVEKGGACIQIDCAPEDAGKKDSGKKK